MECLTEKVQAYESRKILLLFQLSVSFYLLVSSIKLVYVRTSNWTECNYLTPTVPFSFVCRVPALGNLLGNVIFSSSEFPRVHTCSASRGEN